MTRDIVVTKLDRATLALSECKSAMEAKQIADVAEMARVYLERTNASVETVNRATEVRLLAERQMGEFLKAMPKNQGTVLSGRDEFGGTKSEPPKDVPTLREIGITKKQSSQAQKLADIPKEEFEERVALAKANLGKLTVSKVMEPTPIPAVKRRTPTPFSMSGWKDQTRTILEMRLEAVPVRDRSEALQFLAKVVQDLSQ